MVLVINFLNTFRVNVVYVNKNIIYGHNNFHRNFVNFLCTFTTDIVVAVSFPVVTFLKSRRLATT
jgi:hypothetical protein